jgi:putative FmdB family regulatory protein
VRDQTTEANVPTYQYACTACGHRLEAVQSFSDEPLAECPACEGRLRKVFSSVGVVFKGSGFYRTDSRNGAKNGGGGERKEPVTASSNGASTDAGKSSSGDGSGAGSSSGTAGTSGAPSGSTSSSTSANGGSSNGASSSGSSSGSTTAAAKS